MNLQDLFAELILTAFDRFMDFITRGKWYEVRGDEIRIVK